MRAFKLTLLFSIFIQSLSLAQDNPLYNSWNGNELKVGDTAFLYGDKVNFREEPNLNSKVVEQLPIGTPLEILESVKYDGVPDVWYKAKYGDKVGYIKGELLSLTKFTGGRNNDTDFYFSRRDHDDRSYLDIRAVRGKELITEFPVLLYGSHSFSLSMSDDRGLAEVDNLFTIDYHAEACGVDGGLTYVWWSYKQFYHLADLSEIGDGGAFYTTETFIFPEDEGGLPDVIIYDKESTEYYDDETEWTITTKEHRVYRWGGDRLIPSFNRE